jgi:hypothetical protein
MGNQILGYTFMELLKNNTHQINMIKFTAIQSEVAKTIRIRNNAILNFTDQDLYEVLQTYDDFFELNDQWVQLNNYLVSRIEENAIEKRKLIHRLKLNFACGIPTDISYTVEQTIRDLLEV